MVRPVAALLHSGNNELPTGDRLGRLKISSIATEVPWPLATLFSAIGECRYHEALVSGPLRCFGRPAGPNPGGRRTSRGRDETRMMDGDGSLSLATEILHLVPVGQATMTFFGPSRIHSPGPQMCPGCKEERSRRDPPLDITVPKVVGDPRGVQRRTSRSGDEF